MLRNKAVVGVFTYLDDAIETIEAAKDSGYQYKVYSPVPNHHLDEVCTPWRSPIRFITGAGALTGLIGGFALAILCSMDWPMRVGAKDIVSIPGFVVIGYECTILFGALATLFAMFHFSRLPDLFRKVGYDPRFSEDKFGVVVWCANNEVATVSDGMREIGADEVEVKDGL